MPHHPCLVYATVIWLHRHLVTRPLSRTAWGKHAFYWPASVKVFGSALGSFLKTSKQLLSFIHSFTQPQPQPQPQHCFYRPPNLERRSLHKTIRLCEILRFVTLLRPLQGK